MDADDHAQHVSLRKRASTKVKHLLERTVRRRKRDRTLSNASALSTDESSSVSIEEEEEQHNKHLSPPTSPTTTSRGRRSRLLSAPSAPPTTTSTTKRRPAMTVRGPGAIAFMPPPTPTASRSARPAAHGSSLKKNDNSSATTASLLSDNSSSRWRSHDISVAELSPPASPDTFTAASQPASTATDASLNYTESVDELKIGQDETQPLSTSTTTAATIVDPIKEESGLSAKEAVIDDAPAISVTTATQQKNQEQVINDDHDHKTEQQWQQREPAPPAIETPDNNLSNLDETVPVVVADDNNSVVITTTNSLPSQQPDTTNTNDNASSDLAVRVEYFDRQHQGKITMLDTFASLRGLGYHWMVAFPATLVMHLRLSPLTTPYRFPLLYRSLKDWLSLPIYTNRVAQALAYTALRPNREWLQLYGRNVNGVRGLSFGDGFRALRAFEKQSLRWWQFGLWIANRLQWLLTYTMLHDPTTRMVTESSLNSLSQLTYSSP